MFASNYDHGASTESETVLLNSFKSMDTSSISGSHAIMVRGLTKVFGNKVAIHDLNFEVHWGEIFGLLGPNGSGKTTTIRILKGMLPPTSGSAIIGGYPLHQKNLIKSITGFLPENPSVYDRLTGWEYLEFVGLLYNMKEEVLRRRIERFLSMFELWERRNELLSEYSRGMRQIILIGASLLHDPRILFLDEPIISLDVKTAYMVKQLIKMLARRGKAIILTSHWMDLAENLCDRIGMLVDGKLVRVGSINELKTVAKAFMKMIYGQVSLENLDDLFT